MEIIENNSFFRSIGFAKSMSFILNIERQDFIDCFNDNVSDSVNFFGVSSHKKNFHGKIRNVTFDLYRPTKLVNNTNLAMAKGDYQEGANGLKVNVITFLPLMLAFLFFSLFIGALVFSFVLVYAFPATPFFVVGVFASFFVYGIILTYISFRKSVSKLSEDIEREIGYWLAKQRNLQRNA